MNRMAAGAIAWLLVTGGVARAEDVAATEARRRFVATRPQEADLGMYRLDWEPSLTAAQARAQRERRPVFVVVIHAKYGNLRSGHC